MLSLSAQWRRCMTSQLQDCTEYKSTDSPLPPLLNVMYCVRVSLCGQSKYSMRNTVAKGIVGNLCISLAEAKTVLEEAHTQFAVVLFGSSFPPIIPGNLS
jgi:hypothetical protein